MCRTQKMRKMLEEWYEDDEESRAESYFPEDVLPRLFDAVFTKKKNWSWSKKVKFWARFLVQMAIIGRASDVCKQYCPTIADCSFPVLAQDVLADGTPAYIELIWYNWKWRPKKYRKAPYKIRLHANPIDQNYCPVHWLMLHWSLRGDYEGTEPILESLTAKTYQSHVSEIFLLCGLNGSSHSVRRMAAQWASRCGADMSVVRDVGRWSSLEIMLKYLSEGRQMHKGKIRDEGNDPIFNFWVFNFGTQVSSMDTTAQQLLAMASL